MKKHSKTGVESRFQGTALGVAAEPRMIKIEGGAADSIDEWCRRTRERAQHTAPSSKRESRDTTNHVEARTREPSLDMAMETETE